MSEGDDLDPVWKALANRDRRRILDMLRDGPLCTGEVAERLPGLSRFAVMQHLGVLEQAGLISTTPEGRKRLHTLNPVPIRMIYERWVSGYESLWCGILTDLKARAEEPKPARGTHRR